MNKIILSDIKLTGKGVLVKVASHVNMGRKGQEKHHEFLIISSLCEKSILRTGERRDAITTEIMFVSSRNGCAEKWCEVSLPLAGNSDETVKDS